MIMTALVYAQALSRRALAIGYNSLMLPAIAGILALFIGTRPLDGIFVDMATYAQSFNLTQGTGREYFEGDWAFNALTNICALTTSQEIYFFVCACFYMVPVALAMRIAHGEWGFAAFAALIGGFSFYSYGVNGIRNGIATSLLILAFSLRNRKILMIAFMAVAVGMHKSVLLPAVAYLVTCFYSQPWFYMAIWAGSFVLSLTYGEATSNFLVNILPTSGDERLSAYVGNAGFGGDKGGFRLDFVLYSIVPLVVTWAMASKSARKDPQYRQLVCTYVLSNSFWLITMYAAFSNRFAYLSWFMMPWVIIYPFIQKTGQFGMSGGEDGELRHPALLGAALLANFSFTYIMMIYVYQNRGG